MACPSDHPVKWYTVPLAAVTVGGAAISRWKPTTMSVVYGVVVGTPSSNSPSPDGFDASVMCDVRGWMLTDLVVETPSASVAVMMISYHVTADDSPVVGMVNDPERLVSGPRNGWTWVRWWNRTSVVKALSGNACPLKSVAVAA